MVLFLVVEYVNGLVLSFKQFLDETGYGIYVGPFFILLWYYIIDLMLVVVCVCFYYKSFAIYKKFQHLLFLIRQFHPFKSRSQFFLSIVCSRLYSQIRTLSSPFSSLLYQSHLKDWFTIIHTIDWMNGLPNNIYINLLTHKLLSVAQFEWDNFPPS